MINKIFTYCAIFPIFYLNALVSSDLNYSGYKFSSKCNNCLNIDRLPTDKTYSQREIECLEEEVKLLENQLQEVYEKAVNITEEHICHAKNPDTLQVYKNRMQALKKLQNEFLCFVKSFTKQSSVLHGSKLGTLASFYEYLDLINIRINHINFYIDNQKLIGNSN